MITSENKPAELKAFIPRYLPWLLGAGMFVVFLVTLNHWLTPNSLAAMGDISGWNQSVRVTGSVSYIVTYPLRWLPVSLLPLALNLFSAVCSAITLGLLARTVILLPHDRTHDQREREHSEFSILTIKTAWIPPLFAVIVCGLQMTFWENSVQAGFETFNLLIFAYVIRCLLEFRIEQKQSWLTRFAIVYGIGMANNWAMIGFLPLFIVAVMWIKGLSSLKPTFLLNILLLMCLGFLLILFLPIANGLTHATPGFGGSLHANWITYKKIFFGFPRGTVGVLALTALLPILVLGIRWASYFGDNSPLGIFLATSIFHIVHALLLVACIWVALDSPLSPRQIGYGIPFLTFYYLSAISIGYFAGYFLLIFGTKIPKSQSNYYSLIRAVNVVVCLLLAVVLLGTPFLLVRKNYPHLLDEKNISKTFESYFTQMEQSLPETGAVVLGDDSLRLLYLQSILQRHGKAAKFLLIDTHALGDDPKYVATLGKKNRQFQLSDSWLKMENNAPTLEGEIQFLDRLSKDHALYYMDPSFGFYFEHFYLEPHGLAYRLKVYPDKAWDAPLPSKELIAENQKFWKKTADETFPPLIEILKRPVFSARLGKWESFLSSIHLKTETAFLALAAGSYYSRALNYWGVELQKSGEITNATQCFEQAIDLNFANISARVNKFFNNVLITGKQSVEVTPKNVEDLMGMHNGWVDVLNNNGPIDDPNFRDVLSAVLTRGVNYRQAVQQLDRVKVLAPNDIRGPLQLAQLLIYVQSYTNALSQFLPVAHCYADALTNTQLVLNRNPKEPNALFLKGLALIQLEEYQKAIEPLTTLLAQTNNSAALLNRAIAYYKTGNYTAAKPDYEAVLKAIPTTYQAYYALGEIAYHKKDFPTAIKNYQLFLKNVPGDSPDTEFIAGRLKELKASP